MCVVLGKYLLVMELASGGNLLDYLRQKRTDCYHPLSVHEALDFAKQIALGMEHLANQKVICCCVVRYHLSVVGSACTVTWQPGTC